jgi:hypothetical protein
LSLLFLYLCSPVECRHLVTPVSVLVFVFFFSHLKSEFLQTRSKFVVLYTSYIFGNSGEYGPLAEYYEYGDEPLGSVISDYIFG